jgi:hypothetical protein
MPFCDLADFLLHSKDAAAGEFGLLWLAKSFFLGIWGNHRVFWALGAWPFWPFSQVSGLVARNRNEGCGGSARGKYE